MGSTVSDTGRLLLGAGFAFGVGFSMLLLGAVTLTVASGTGDFRVPDAVLATLVAGVFFATVVGLTLYLLAFPENRVELPVEWLPATTPADDEETTSE